MFSYVLARENSRKILEHNFQIVLRGNFGSLGAWEQLSGQEQNSKVVKRDPMVLLNLILAH
jgi:hypothetical protein